MGSKKTIKQKNTPTDHLHKCLKCGSACCRYITISISTPRTKLDFNNLLWQLYHQNIKAFKDDNGWYLLIDAPCAYLEKGGTCGIYGKRPVTCREYSVDNCEYGSTMEEIATLYFATAASLELYCRKRFKKWDTWIEKQ